MKAGLDPTRPPKQGASRVTADAREQRPRQAAGFVAHSAAGGAAAASSQPAARAVPAKQGHKEGCGCAVCRQKQRRVPHREGCGCAVCRQGRKAGRGAGTAAPAASAFSGGGSEDAASADERAGGDGMSSVGAGAVGNPALWWRSGKRAYLEAVPQVVTSAGRPHQVRAAALRIRRIWASQVLLTSKK
jgi:hypothetical protein